MSDSDYYGVAANQWVPNVNNHVKIAQTLASAGVTFVRMRALRWAYIQPTKKGGMNWGVWSAVYKAYTDRGMKILVPFLDTPEWATSGKAHTGAPRRKAWRKFVRAAVIQFPEVYAWEVWNEPDIKKFFTGSAAQYVRMHKQAYNQIKKHSDAQVWGPAMTYSGTFKKKGKKIVKGVFDSKKLDMFTYHDYAPLANKVNNGLRIKSLVKRRYPVSITEISSAFPEEHFDVPAEWIAMEVKYIYTKLKGVGMSSVMWWPVADYGGNLRGLIDENYNAKAQLDMLETLIKGEGA